MPLTSSSPWFNFHQDVAASVTTIAPRDRAVLVDDQMESVQASDRGGARRGERVGGCGRANEVLYDRQTGKSRGFAFLTMSCVEDYNAVIENLDERVFKADFGLQDIENNF
nr:28 kDa ribonucleoprotein, chloroplastic-like [Ipomoea trifida]